MTVTVTHIEIPGAALPYTALIDRDGVLVRYSSVLEPDCHFDVLRVRYVGEPEWLGSSWGWLWSGETRALLESAAIELLHRKT
jgi:hypothetical protein